MNNQTNLKMYPKSVLTLYLKLYCSRRDSSKNKMMEGIQSWLTLSKSEKQQFLKRFKECQLQYKNKMANLLKKTQPFMRKKKNLKRFIEVKTAKSEANIDYDEGAIIESSNRTSENHNIYMETVNDPEFDNNCDVDMPSPSKKPPSEADYHNKRESFNKEEYGVQVLAEPPAPSIRTARELFQMLNTNNEKNNTWASLSDAQKSRYRKATALLKNDYITKYKAFLENLPSKKLYDYYNSFFN